MNGLSRRILEMEESQTLAMAKKSRELKAKGIHIINMNLGEPDFSTPQHIKDAAKVALDEGYTFYTPVSGLAELREGIAEKLRTQNGLDCKAENIVVSTGAKQSIANVMMSLVNPNDEVIIVTPYWVSYAGIVQLAEGKAVFVKGTAENDYKATAAQIEAAITDKTKAIIFSSPCNPTGSVFGKDELSAIADVVAKHPNLYIIADEIYEHINFTSKHASLGSFENIKNQTITVNGFSKGFAMTGWRVGYISAPVHVAKACDKIQGQVTSGTNAVAQRAALAAISGDMTPTQEMGTAYLRRRNLIKSLLDEIEGFKTNLPEGAFYIFPDISYFFGKSDGENKINNSTDFCMYLLNVAHVSTVMGAAFGEDNCIRVSFATSDDNIKEAVSRIKKAVANLV
jgi:aspartate aminotransferase